MKAQSPFFFEFPVSTGKAEIQPGVRMLAHSYINGGRIESGVYIGRYCSIGLDVIIGSGHHDMRLLSTSSWFESGVEPTLKYAEPDVRVRIKHDVWIGNKVQILSGVTIGTGAVIGAGAVVTKDVPDYAVVAGVPAAFLKWRFEESIRNRLLQSRWWEINDELLRSKPLGDIESSLEWIESIPDTERTLIRERIQKI